MISDILWGLMLLIIHFLKILKDRWK